MSTARLSSALLCVLLACSRGTAQPPPPDAEPPAVAVQVVRASVQEIAEPIAGTGTVEADKQVDIGPRVDGTIEEIFVQVGDRVDAGAKLFRTRDVDYRIRVEEASYAQRLAAAEARKARRDLSRAEELFRSDVLSSEQIEAARTADDAARAREGQARTALARARQELADTLVQAPYPGAITQRFVDEGVMLRTMLSSGAAVVQLMKMDVVIAVVRVPEVHLRRIRVGTPARLQVDGLEGSFEGAVSIVSDRVDPGSRSIEVRVPIPNPDLVLKPGLFAKVELRPEPHRALVVERRAVLGRAPDRYVMVPENGRAARRAVEVRDLDALHLEVVSGLEDGSALLIAPPGVKLDEGAAFAAAPADAAL
jgi:RND family efflux transporter MFP subunit